MNEPSAVVLSSKPASLEPRWQVVLRTRNNGLVLWDRERDALRLQSASNPQLDSNDDDDQQQHGFGVEDDDEGLEVISATGDDDIPSTLRPSVCPLCRQKLSAEPIREPASGRNNRRLPKPASRVNSVPTSNPGYFSLLSAANSRTQSPRTTARDGGNGTASDTSTPLDQSSLNQGYYGRFFVEIEKLGKGGNGTVHLVRHVLNGEGLGLYACKRVAIGDSSSRLPQLLREVHILESLQHPNLIAYHHVWVEECRLTAFGPPIPTLHLLMAYANGGDLATFVALRSGATRTPEAEDTPQERVKKFKMRNLSSVHLLRLDEILDLFEDCCCGLAFLHSRNILHLDLKAENILLHWDEDALLPRAKISDLGSSGTTKELSTRMRTGGSGTLDWTPPESWERDPKNGRLRAPDRSTDLWSLGLILYLMSFFTLPYHNVEDNELLEEEIKAYPGFFISDALSIDHGTRHDLPTGLLRLMTRLIHRDPLRRPSCIEVMGMLEHIRENTIPSPTSLAPDAAALVKQRTPSPSVTATPLPPVPSFAPLPDVVELAATAPAMDLGKKSRRQLKILLPFISPQNTAISKGYIIASALVKVISIQKKCSSGTFSPTALCSVLAPTLVEVASPNLWVSLFLWTIHLTLVMHGSYFVNVCIS
ncbi:kinase-like protein [Meredithblackwellia eburnea MCA 4105]